ncbi:hypothetical protein [Saccharopolyspora karakumensis]|uniref:hypothetical protein n=1 Tax=Saccharopolyspora karakumensis TaxID=2530386 RepID=UPI0038B5F6B3
MPFHKLGTANLVVDRLLDGGLQGHASDDPIAQLLPVGNQGGFRYKSSPERGSVQLVVLYTTGAESDWPDSLDLQTGIFTYYGDNKRPGANYTTPAARESIHRPDSWTAWVDGRNYRSLTAPPTTTVRSRED